MPESANTIAEEIATEIKEREANGGRKRARSITNQNDAESIVALEALAPSGAAEVVGADIQSDGFTDFARKARDRILALRANPRYWEGTLSYSARCHLNGALVILQEMLQDKDDAKLPLTMARYLGITVPLWPKR